MALKLRATGLGSGTPTRPLAARRRCGVPCSPISTTSPIFGMPIQASGAHSHSSGKVRPGEIWLKACDRSAIAARLPDLFVGLSFNPTQIHPLPLAGALNISSFENSARRGSILFRCERTYSCAVTLRAKINAAESCLTKQCWLLLLQPAKNREYIGLAAL
jgi:hypothetical protein